MDPNLESLKLYEASQYSHACSLVKYTPKITVPYNNNPLILLFFVIRAWCLIVTVIPEANRMVVFNKGT